MANSLQKAAEKRQRLVDSAKALFHEQGVHPTTLAEVAERAGVPLGNVYYYFKTKDELVSAVVESRADEARRLIGSFDQKRTPQARLKALAQQWVDDSNLAARYGCPIGSLCSELAKDPEHKQPAEAPFALILDWAEEQLRQLGQRDARDLAFSLLARIQGASLLAHTFHDPEILRREARLIDRWVDTL
jgi:AcrR family transcriptional regulator